MDITGFIWHEEVEDKLIKKHHISPAEVEEVFANRPKIHFHERGSYQGEDMYRALGRTYEGRYVVVLFIFKSTGEALVITARSMDQKERRNYANK